MSIDVTEAAEEIDVKPRRAHRRTRPLEPEISVAAATAAALEPVLPEPAAPLVSIAQSRRSSEIRRLELILEQYARNTQATVLRLRQQGSPVTEIARVESAMRQSTAEKQARLACIEAMSNRDLVIEYVPENTGWLG